MKLEPRHLAPYVIYKIKLRYIDCITNRNRTAFLTGITAEGIETTYSRKIKGCSGDFIGFTGNNNIYLLKLKPILRPLSDFKGMIVRDIKIELELSHNQVMEFFGFMDGEIKLDNITLGLYNAMCKKQIDFKGLIEKGLAININTL
jgi:hypothetical protein